MGRVMGRKMKLIKSNADFAYLLLDLSGNGRVLDAFSKAYHKCSKDMPSVIASIIRTTFDSLPALPNGRDAKSLSTISGVIETVS